MAIPQKLERLSGLYGVQTSYRDMRGKQCEASAESLLAVIRALGAEVGGVDDVARALVRRKDELWRRVVDPVVVAWDGGIPPIRIRTAETTSGMLQHSLTLESGESHVSNTSLAKLSVRRQQKTRSARYLERELTIRRRLPGGYHEITVEIDGTAHTILIISAPTQAYFPWNGKEWGIFAPVYALHSESNPNAGDLKDFEALMDCMGSYGGRVGATLPLLASFLDKPFEPSPYSPASRLFWNEFYIHAEAARRPRQSDLVDYAVEMKRRRAVLEKEAAAFFKTGASAERRRFEEFVKQETELEHYARFRAVTERQQAGWSEWPAPLRDGRIKSADYDKNVERYHLYAQWRIQSQLRSLAGKARQNGQLLYLDLPLGLHPESYDIWRYRRLFVLGAAGGAPPDPVFTKGQNWGFPPMHPEMVRLAQHRYTIAFIRNHLRYARMLRIDHVMGLHRLFWIPSGFTGDRGVYVEYPAEELYAILSLESHRNEAGIVGENLGTAPPEMNRSMQRHNIRQMSVIQYDVEAADPERRLRSIPANAVASLNTHDMPPFRAFWEGLDIEDRLDLELLDEAGAARERRRRSQIKRMLIDLLRKERLLGDDKRVTPEDAFKAILELVAASMANVVLLNIEDLWGEVLPQNVPATQTERPNWRRRARLSIEEIRQSKDAKQILALVERARRLA